MGVMSNPCRESRRARGAGTRTNRRRSRKKAQARWSRRPQVRRAMQGRRTTMRRNVGADRSRSRSRRGARSHPHPVCLPPCASNPEIGASVGHAECRDSRRRSHRSGGRSAEP